MLMRSVYLVRFALFFILMKWLKPLCNPNASL
jgi:hypothetical protein